MTTNTDEEQSSYIISLSLVKKLSELSCKDSQKSINEFLTTNGVPKKLSSKAELSTYLYFHQMLIPFYPVLSQLSSGEIGKVLETSCKENYYLLSDVENKHFNFDLISEETFDKLEEKSEDAPTVNFSKDPSTKGTLNLNKCFLTLGAKGNGRLDVYVKAHIAKNLILFLGVDELSNYIKIYETMENDLNKLIEAAKVQKFTAEKYIEMVEMFSNPQKRDDMPKQVMVLSKLLFVFQNVSDKESINNLERLFIQLLGHFEREVRNQAVVGLNMIYDESNWQEKNAYPLSLTKIKLLDDQLKLEVKIKKADYEEQGIILITNSPCENFDVKNNVVSFLKCQNKEEKDDIVKLDFPLGTSKKCGYYDWYLAKFKDGNYSNVKVLDENDKLIDGKGRFIVLDKDIKDLSVHEVFCDLIGAQIDKGQGRIIKRGSFKTLEDKLDEYSQRYINCLYIMGALERDNDIAYDENTAEPIDIANSEASPMAITDRASISSLLGGEKAFKSLMTKCKKLSMKIILDCLGRISSSRANRKYRDVVLHYLDNKGKLQICYGSDGQSVNYDDSAILNYRKLESWNLLITEVLDLVDKYHIDGIHLDNCQAWPQIMEINASELFRIDNDGKPHYSAMEIMNGEIVLPTEESGFYNSDCYETYPNPMLVKLTKTIWQKYPNFVFFGECWLNEKFSNNRHVALSRSGIIPRMYTLPIILTEILGKKISRDGRINKTEPKDVSLLKKWYEENYRELPEGALLVQSSTGQIWPYPALLYGRGTWSAIDLLFTLPDIPMTFMEEIDGEAYRVQIVNVYESKEGKTGTSSQNLMSKKTRSKSLMKLIESKEQEKRELAEKEKLSTSSSTSNISEYLPSVNLADNVSSLISLSGINITNVNEMERKQSDIVKQLGPEQGFDLNKIKFHYNNRRKMRNNHESLRRGKLIYLKAIGSNGKEHPGVFAFARQGEDETGIFAINFTNDKTNFKLDLSSLLTTKSDDGSVFDEKNNFNSICYIEDWVSDEKGDIYFTRELIQGHVDRTIEPYGAICFGFSIIPFTQENYKIVMDKSNGRMINELKSQGGSVDSYQVSLQLKEILKKKLPLDEFAKWLNYTENLLGQYSISFYDYIQKLNFVKNNKTYSTDFFRYCYKMKELKSYISNTKLADEAEKLLTSNILGPIVFVTPELGRWSTVGGLGVMVDELSQGLRTLGQEVIMISPYYDRNRKGQQNYLAQDPFNIKYIRNIEVQLDQKYTFGIHKGEGNGGIQYYFIHNAEIFPRPYPDFGAAGTTRQIALFAKASLQLLCDIQTIPAIVVTNDWFTGLTPAYAKTGAFGDTFKGSTFIHICHNLEPTYEGRIYPSPQEGTLDNIHQLRTDILVDPWWKQKVINPSRCALMMSDQWSTVSPSYRQELLDSSPLAPILRQKSQPFAYCNGIFKVLRLKALQEKAGTDRVACKKLIQTKYFGYKDVDLNVPIYSFVGRLTQQKGVLLILDAAEEIIRRTGGKVNILVGGMGNPKDPYCAACINKINYLKSKYSYAFWANPFEFFTDGPKVNFGSDFGLMPSLFEPGGIVQQEFFIAGTPVIAFRTGGLKDTVFEFNYDKNTGNGFTFDYYNAGELINAMQRSLDLFKNKEKFEICRKNAFDSAIDVADVSEAWCREFYRLRGKIFYNTKAVMEDMKNEPVNNEEREKTINVLNTLTKDTPYVFKKEETDLYAQKAQKLPKKNIAYNLAPQSIIVDGEMRFPISFSFSEDGKKLSSVQVCGSFDKWQVRHPLSYDPVKNVWNITLKVKKGKYFYKYIVDGQWVVNKKEQTVKESNGIENNTVTI